MAEAALRALVEQYRQAYAAAAAPAPREGLLAARRSLWDVLERVDQVNTSSGPHEALYLLVEYWRLVRDLPEEERMAVAPLPDASALTYRGIGGYENVVKRGYSQ